MTVHFRAVPVSTDRVRVRDRDILQGSFFMTILVGRQKSCICLKSAVSRHLSISCSLTLQHSRASLSSVFSEYNVAPSSGSSPTTHQSSNRRRTQNKRFINTVQTSIINFAFPLNTKMVRFYISRKCQPFNDYDQRLYELPPPVS